MPQDKTTQTRREQESLRLQQKLAEEKHLLGQAYAGLGRILSRRPGAVGLQPVPEELSLLAACRRICDFQQISFKDPPKHRDTPLRLLDIAHLSGFRTRDVLLRGKWWHRDNGPMLAFFEEGRQAVALLPDSSRRYRLYDPVAGTEEPVDARRAAALAPRAYTFYRPFPHKNIRGVDLLKFGLQNCLSDLSMVVLMGGLAALLGLFIPWVTGIIFDTVIPEAARSQLWQIVALLLTCAFVTTTFNLTKGIAIVRIEGKVDKVLQAAVWDRLLSLPVPFFRQFTVGDLANRGMGISAIRMILSGIVVNTVLTFVFTSCNLLLLFYYDWQLALVALSVLGAAISIILLLTYFQYRYQRQIMDLEGRLTGLVLQFISGISKLRITATEDRAFALWAEQFSTKKRLAYKSGLVKSGLLSFNAMLPVVSLITLFTWVVWKRLDCLSTGDFLAFNAAYASFQNASLQMAVALTTSLNIFPLYERAKPILETLPESSESRADPGILSGALEVNQVSFRYNEDAPLVLREVSFRVNPGEFVAIVGNSGCGKSTLFRLLLGFETPESGTIYYDNHDLATLELGAVRRQLGVVLQNASLFSGDIFKNIVGNTNLTLDDAWEAARMVGLDADIKAMPMQMHTVVPADGSTLSGGQKQRIIIARAIVKRPKILFFDEATSALDNQTQAITSHSLETLAVTRIVIAHRLSTIINADRILVVEGGRIVQSGNYQQLMAQEGPFVEMARRQIA
jgi:ATP-binding cassette subfamily C protein